MNNFRISFAGAAAAIQAKDQASSEFLALLFNGLLTPIQSVSGPQLSLAWANQQKAFSVVEEDVSIYEGQSKIQCAAVLYDRTIFHLLNEASGGAALHCGCVWREKKLILIPGRSGAGKSTLVWWLTDCGYRYLTDELIFIHEQASKPIDFFTRPVCLKTGALPLLEASRSSVWQQMLRDRHGALLRPRCDTKGNAAGGSIPSLPSLVLLPQYLAGSPLGIEKISRARLVGLLLQCHANARNLKGHGFTQMVSIARATPAYLIRYGSFAGIVEAIEATLNRIGQE